MKLVDLFLNRWLYREVNQNIETKDAVFDSSNIIPVAVPPLPAGGAAQDINTNNVTINGGQITPGTLILQVGDWGWGQTCVFSSTTLNKVSWTGGNFKTAAGTIYTILAGDTTARLTAAGLTSPMNAKVYIYLDLNLSDSLYHCTYTPGNSVGVGKVLIAVAKDAAVVIPPATQTNATYNLTEASQIVGDNILANTINAGKMSVGQLSAITADLGTITSGDITGTIIRTAGSGVNRMVISSPGSVVLEWFNTSNNRKAVIGYTFSSDVFYITTDGQIQFNPGVNFLVRGDTSIDADLYVTGNLTVDGSIDGVADLNGTLVSLANSIIYILTNCCP